MDTTKFFKSYTEAWEYVHEALMNAGYDALITDTNRLYEQSKMCEACRLIFTACTNADDMRLTDKYEDIL